MLALKIVLLVLGSYLIGNINFAKIISKALNRDITKEGSGNPGTMNMFRTFGLKPALLTLFLEALKGAIPALVGLFLLQADGLSQVGIYSAGLAVILGHNFPVFYKFKGGKGVASSFGVFMVANPLFGFLAFVAGVTTVVICDYGAVGTFAFLVFFILSEGIYLIFKGQYIAFAILMFIVLLTFFMHRSNIKRLCNGSENQMHFTEKIKSAFKKKDKEIEVKSKDDTEK